MKSPVLGIHLVFLFSEVSRFGFKAGVVAGEETGMFCFLPSSGEEQKGKRRTFPLRYSLRYPLALAQPLLDCL